MKCSFCYEISYILIFILWLYSEHWINTFFFLLVVVASTLYAMQTHIWSSYAIIPTLFMTATDKSRVKDNKHFGVPNCPKQFFVFCFFISYHWSPLLMSRRQNWTIDAGLFSSFQVLWMYKKQMSLISHCMTYLWPAFKV